MLSRQSDYRIRFATMAVIGTLLGQSAQATENPASPSWGGAKVLEFGKGLMTKDRGFSIAEDTYTQSAKMPDKYGLSMNPEQKRYSFSFSHRGFSVQKRF